MVSGILTPTGNHTSNDTASHLRRLESSARWYYDNLKSHIVHFLVLCWTQCFGKSICFCNGLYKFVLKGALERSILSLCLEMWHNFIERFERFTTTSWPHPQKGGRFLRVSVLVYHSKWYHNPLSNYSSVQEIVSYRTVRWGPKPTYFLPIVLQMSLNIGGAPSPSLSHLNITS